MKIQELSKRLGTSQNQIVKAIGRAKRHGFGINWKGKLRELSAWRTNPELESRAVFLLSTTLKPMNAIAKETRLLQSHISAINAKHSCRSPLITRALGQRTGLDWRKLPLTNHFNRAEKNQILMACTEEIGKMVWKKYKRELERREDAQGKALVSALEALGHYSPEFGNPRLFALLAAQRAIREEVFENNTHDYGQRKILARAISQYFKSGRRIKAAK